MTHELKPCPFCGGQAKLKEISGRWTVHCANHCVGTRISNNKEWPITDWNRRVETDCAKWQAEAKRLKTAINQYIADCNACEDDSSNCGNCYWYNNGDCSYDGAKWRNPMGFLADLCDNCPFQKDCREFYTDKIAELKDKIAELKVALSKGGE